jgi:hypothetical protein
MRFIDASVSTVDPWRITTDPPNATKPSRVPWSRSSPFRRLRERLAGAGPLRQPASVAANATTPMRSSIRLAIIAQANENRYGV